MGQMSDRNGTNTDHSRVVTIVYLLYSVRAKFVADKPLVDSFRGADFQTLRGEVNGVDSGEAAFSQLLANFSRPRGTVDNRGVLVVSHSLAEYFGTKNRAA